MINKGVESEHAKLVHEEITKLHLRQQSEIAKLEVKINNLHHEIIDLQ